MGEIILKYRPDLWYKVCKCGNITHYKTYGSYLANKCKKEKAPCKECRYKSHSQKMKGRKRPPFSDKWKRNIAIGHKKSDVWKQSMNTPEYKEKQRQKMLRLIREGKYGRVGYNLEACKIFDYINTRLGWNGQHAKYNGEKSVESFILDYYEPNLNIVIEWDEKHHKKAKHRQYDGFRQKIITDTIGCEFYRVDDTTKSVRKVDKIPTDRSMKLQNTLNEYYENQN